MPRRRSGKPRKAPPHRPPWRPLGRLGPGLITGAAAQLIVGWGGKTFTVCFALASLGLQLFVPYHRYVHFLKWLTLALFAYVGVIFTVRIDWPHVLTATFLPEVALTGTALTVI